MGAGLRLGLSLFAVVCAGSSVSWGDEWVHGEVQKIVDGDTIHFTQNQKSRDKINIRMVGIDTPEAHVPVDGKMVGQGYWGDAATEMLENLIPVGTKVDMLTFGVDKYNRVLGRIYFDEHDVNYTMVRSGWAIPYIICSGPRCDANFFERENVGDYLQACDIAREEQRGVFDPARPLPEWPFVFRMRVTHRKPEKFVGDYSTRKLYAPSEYEKVDVCRRIFFMNAQEALRLGFKPASAKMQLLAPSF